MKHIFGTADEVSSRRKILAVTTQQLRKESLKNLKNVVPTFIVVLACEQALGEEEGREGRGGEGRGGEGRGEGARRLLSFGKRSHKVRTLVSGR